ncbi:MAG: ABC transporter ATP-binding protein [Candidatus Cybelea sp.]|jgi:putative ABC transport system ATP-binding protein
MNERDASQRAIELREITKVYANGALRVPALHGISFVIERGEYVAIMGPSGSGKSTLMNLIGCLDSPTSGTYLLDGVDVSKLDDNALAAVRLRKMGFVFQGFNLLARTDALRNVALPLFYAGLPAQQRLALAQLALEQVGLGDRSRHQPSQLSGGEQQRVAVARALINDPAVLLADEPTGNLDSKTGEEIMALFSKLHGSGRTIVVVTHDEQIALNARRVIRLRDGLVVSDTICDFFALRG